MTEDANSETTCDHPDENVHPVSNGRVCLTCGKFWKRTAAVNHLRIAHGCAEPELLD